MVFKTIRQIISPILEGRDDAKAAMAQPNFTTTMELVESLPLLSQQLIAQLVEHELMKKLAEKVRKYIPVDCQQEKDYLQFADSKGLQLVAEDYFSGARTLSTNLDTYPQGQRVAGIAGIAALELAAYYLLARSWQTLNHAISIDAPKLGAPMIGLRIETRIHEFLEKYGRSLPRSC